MVYIKNNDVLKIGDRVVTTREISSINGTFTVGSEVTITGICERGYEITDDEGNSICEIGWDGLKKS